mmetsp:Transcript_15742/g.26556  ORF Transcript_15742/g.26556 Transcript_15742/m.26556 type:complete len:430 (+) Transcript_15742:106-1395(+)|eukprot:CAMPEP_0198197436 /NCGR_PEP_ID=MMETSP1445-20131203/1062_1 /TAXON_ID=36898 /ORGANISM="Pyramimonas sp., Strain CCMP2087" /LENGTH=429 /DNA_ID=CAMNT_0043866729 /DNA_START=84 /DNA_END=1373 /DNA_ORIENTATION=+
MPSAHDEDTVREDVQDFIDLPKTAAIHAVSLVKSWSKARRLRFLMGVIEVQNAAKNCGRRNTQRVVRAQGGVKPGGAKKLVHVLSKYVFPNSRNTTAIGSICANSKAAMGLSPSGELRTFYVGQVVVLKNDDAKKENWYVMITKLTPPSISNPKRVGYGVWLWGQEDVRAHPGCRRFVMEGSDREVMLSEYEFEINVDNVIAVCRANPGFLDNGLENDLVYHSYFDYAEKAIHALTEPTTPGRQKDLATVLLLHRSIALRANPGAVAIFGIRLKSTVYTYCRNREALIRPSVPRIKMAVTMDSFLGGISDELLEGAQWKKDGIKVVVEHKESLNYLLGENWWKVVVLPKHKGRDFIDFTLSLPVAFTFKPTDDFMLLTLTSMKKQNMMGQVQWDTRYGRKGPPVVDGDEAESESESEAEAEGVDSLFLD